MLTLIKFQLPQDYSNPEAGQNLAELRRLIFEGEIPEAEKLGRKMLGRPPLQQPYQPLGDLRLRFPGHDKVEQYKRSLDLDQAPGGGDRQLMVRGANSVTLVLCAATSFRNYQDVSADPGERVDQTLSAACRKTFTKLLKNHLADYQPLFRRVALDLGTSPAAALPTDRLIAEFTREGDTALVALYYQFGRYLLLASSRPGGQPANLQGIWNQELWPSWSSKWTCNINVEMNYWATETANLRECHEPLFDRCMKASEILDVDKDFHDQLEVARRRLPPLQTGGQGQLQEWRVKIINIPDNYADGS